ncbi:MAG: glycosyltransferase family 2 protein [Anaerolineae bacterium]|nr:glycosyltransferase family 2 protein [Anaerolineae bacterium]
MRVGSNPVRNRYPVYQPKKIGIVSITFMPVLEGFFRESLDVFAIHLQSLRQTIGDQADVMVFDNGSCDEVTEFLSQQYLAGAIDWLMLSRHNIGKTGVLNWIFSSLPNEFIVSTDSDVLFRPGWIERSLAVFDVFEQVGIVSAQPGFFNETGRMRKIAEKMSPALSGVQIDEVDPFSDAFEEYCDGVNASAEIRQKMAQNRLLLLTPSQGNTQAVMGSTSMQFMIRRDAARKVIPLPTTHTLDSDDHMQINQRMEALGYLQLSTTDALVYHMGNSLQGRHAAEAFEVRQRAGVSVAPALNAAHKKRHLIKSVLTKAVKRSAVLERIVRRLYSLLFDLLYAEK